MPEKSQPMTFAGGRDIEACLSEVHRVSNAKFWLEEMSMQPIHRVQRDIGDLHKDLVGLLGENRNVVQGRSPQCSRHQSLHGCCCHTNGLWLVALLTVQ